MAQRVGWWMGVAVLMVLGGAACSSDTPRTAVKGEVVSRPDPNLGGPDAAVAEFRAGERDAYGGG